MNNELSFFMLSNIAMSDCSGAKNFKPFKCLYCSFRCLQKGNLKLHSCMKRNVNGVNLMETDVQKRFVKKLEAGGWKVQQNRTLATGRADIIASRTIDEQHVATVIEVKVWADWQKALGQVLTYATALNKGLVPRYKPAILFFGRAPALKRVLMISRVLRHVGIDMWISSVGCCPSQIDYDEYEFPFEAN